MKIIAVMTIFHKQLRNVTNLCSIWQLSQIKCSFAHKTFIIYISSLFGRVVDLSFILKLFKVVVVRYSKCIGLQFFWFNTLSCTSLCTDIVVCMPYIHQFTLTVYLTFLIFIHLSHVAKNQGTVL